MSEPFVLPPLCESCGHPRALHYRDVDNIARCRSVESGVSTSGVIGIPWSRGCDCEEFVSRQAEAEKDRNRRRLAEMDRLAAEIRAMEAGL